MRHSERDADLHRENERIPDTTGAARPKNALDVRLKVEPRRHVVLVVQLENGLVFHPGLAARDLRSTEIGAEVSVEAEQPEHVTVPPGHEPRVEEAALDEVLDRVQVRGRVGHGEESAQSLMPRRRFLPELLLYRRVDLVRPGSSIAAL